MKNTKQCPKCNSSNIAIPKYSGYRLSYSIIKDLYCSKIVCLNCGYVEDWILNNEDLVKLAKYMKENKGTDF